jgi:Uma2 family endonuclease
MAIHTAADVSLEAGDHLTQAEFHRRYGLRPDINRAHLVEGIVYIGGRVRLREHGEPHAKMVGWLGFYVADHPDANCLDAVSLILDDRNEIQPDVLLWRPETGGARIDEEGCLVGPPQLIVEVTASSVSYDLHEKKEAYRRNGVGEYVVWRVLDQAIDRFRLIDGQYVLIEQDAEGVVESEQFPGLRLHVPTMLAGDLTTVLARLGPASEA